MQTKFAIIIFGGLAAVYAVSSVAEMLIRRGAVELDRDTLDKVWRREARRAGVWKSLETIAFICLLGGLAIIFRVLKLPSGAFWGYGTLAVGMAIFCFASAVRAWISHAAYSAEAPNTKASGGARTGAVLTTMAECMLGGAVCWYVFTHVTWPSSLRNSGSSPPVPTATSTSTSTSTSNRPSMFVGESEAVQLLGKDVKYLKALAKRSDIRTHEINGVTEYRRDDIITTKDAGIPTAEELGLEPEPEQK